MDQKQFESYVYHELLQHFEVGVRQMMGEVLEASDLVSEKQIFTMRRKMLAQAGNIAERVFREVSNKDIEVFVEINERTKGHADGLRKIQMILFEICAKVGEESA